MKEEKNGYIEASDEKVKVLVQKEGHDGAYVELMVPNRITARYFIGKTATAYMSNDSDILLQVADSEAEKAEYVNIDYVINIIPKPTSNNAINNNRPPSASSSDMSDEMMFFDHVIEPHQPYDLSHDVFAIYHDDQSILFKEDIISLITPNERLTINVFNMLLRINVLPNIDKSRMILLPSLIYETCHDAYEEKKKFDDTSLSAMWPMVRQRYENLIKDIDGMINRSLETFTKNNLLKIMMPVLFADHFRVFYIQQKEHHRHMFEIIDYNSNTIKDSKSFYIPLTVCMKRMYKIMYPNDKDQEVNLKIDNQDSNLPVQRFGSVDCGLYAIRYAQYILSNNKNVFNGMVKPSNDSIAAVRLAMYEELTQVLGEFDI